MQKCIFAVILVSKVACFMSILHAILTTVTSWDIANLVLTLKGVFVEGRCISITDIRNNTRKTTNSET